eukprot:g79.t1
MRGPRTFRSAGGMRAMSPLEEVAEVAARGHSCCAKVCVVPKRAAPAACRLGEFGLSWLRFRRHLEVLFQVDAGEPRHVKEAVIGGILQGLENDGFSQAWLEQVALQPASCRVGRACLRLLLCLIRNPIGIESIAPFGALVRLAESSGAAAESPESVGHGSRWAARGRHELGGSASRLPMAVEETNVQFVSITPRPDPVVSPKASHSAWSQSPEPTPPSPQRSQPPSPAVRFTKMKSNISDKSENSIRDKHAPVCTTSFSRKSAFMAKPIVLRIGTFWGCVVLLTEATTPCLVGTRMMKDSGWTKEPVYKLCVACFWLCWLAVRIAWLLAMLSLFCRDLLFGLPEHVPLYFVAVNGLSELPSPYELPNAHSEEVSQDSDSHCTWKCERGELIDELGALHKDLKEAHERDLQKVLKTTKPRPPQEQDMPSPPSEAELADFSLAWAWLLLIVMMYLPAIFVTQTFGRNDPPDATLTAAFGTLPRSMYTLFKVMTMETWADLARYTGTIINGAEIFFVLYIFCTSFAVMNCVVAVIVQNTCVHAKERQEDMRSVQEKNDANAMVKILEVFQSLCQSLAEGR